MMDSTRAPLVGRGRLYSFGSQPLPPKQPMPWMHCSTLCTDGSTGPQHWFWAMSGDGPAAGHMIISFVSILLVGVLGGLIPLVKRWVQFLSLLCLSNEAREHIVNGHIGQRCEEDLDWLTAAARAPQCTL